MSNENKKHELVDNVIPAEVMIFRGHDLPTLFRRTADYLEDSCEAILAIHVAMDEENDEYRLEVTV